MSIVSKIWNKLVQKYKLVVLHEASLQQRKVMRVNKLQLFLVVLFFAVVMFGLGFAAMRFMGNGLESVPLETVGATTVLSNKTNSKKEVKALAKRVLELEEDLENNHNYIENLRTILKGNSPTMELDTVVRHELLNTDTLDLMPSDIEKDFRETIDADRFISITESNNDSEDSKLLFTPLKGVITAGYDASINHLAIDIAAKKGEPIKAAGSGTVIFADWTPETGHVLLLRHNDGKITVYKHNDLLYKNSGDFVERGEVIAAVGNTGEITTGPHLHFELWIDGKAANPETYIDF